MHQITDLHDKALYAPLHDAMDTSIEPWHLPHFNAQLQQPKPAEAATDVGVDQDDLPKPLMGVAGAAVWAVYVAVIAATLLGVHGWFAGWFA